MEVVASLSPPPDHGDVMAGTSAAVLGGDRNVKVEPQKLWAKSGTAYAGKSLRPGDNDMELSYSLELFTSRYIFHGKKIKLCLVYVLFFFFLRLVK